MGGLELLRVAPGSQSRNQGPQSYSLKELNSSNFLMSLKAGYAPKPADESLAQPTPVSTLMRTQVSLLEERRRDHLPSCQWARDYWDTAGTGISPQEDEIQQKALFPWNCTPGFPKSQFPQSSHKISVAGASVELLVESKPVSSFHSILEPGSVQHQVSLASVSHCSPLVHCMWGLYGHGSYGQISAREPRAKSHMNNRNREQQEN